MNEEFKARRPIATNVVVKTCKRVRSAVSSEEETTWVLWK